MIEPPHDLVQLFGQPVVCPFRVDVELDYENCEWNAI
jgi:hypothetical protein